MKRFSKLMCGVLALFLVFSLTVSAHSGRTDSNGGHKDNKNVSGLGSYHYHCGGNPPHLHDGGGCPYSSSYAVSTPTYEKETEYIPPAPTYDTITIAEGTPTQLKVGQSHELGFSIDFVDGQEYTIESSDAAVISVTDNILKCVGEGTAKITVKTSNNEESITVSVIPVPVEAITSSDIELKLYNEAQVTFKIKPSDATNHKISYSSSDESVVQVDVSGKLTSISEGNSTITLTAINGVTTSINVKVYEIRPDEIKTHEDEYDIEITKKASLKYEILPTDSQNTEHTITIQDPSIIDIDKDGKISPKAVGETFIEIKTWNDVIKIIPVNVFSIPVESILIDESGIDYVKKNKIDINTQLSLKAISLPEDATYPDIIWKSSNSEIIAITNNNPEIVGTGKVELTASTQEGTISVLSLEVIDKNQIIITLVVVIIIVFFLVVILHNRKKKKIASNE